MSENPYLAPRVDLTPSPVEIEPGPADATDAPPQPVEIPPAVARALHAIQKRFKRLTTQRDQLHGFRAKGYPIGYLPHDGKGAQARRLRQMARQQAKQARE